MNSLTALSPLDGRYQASTKKLATYFSEAALMRYRLIVEIEYFIALSKQKAIPQLPTFNEADTKYLRKLYQQFKLADAQKIKDIEKTTNHDVKAVEYFIKEKIANTGLTQYSEFIHFSLTSEDINNLSYSLMLQNGLHKVVIPKIQEIIQALSDLATAQADTPLLSLTHGQSATPTTVGKEIAVFINRLKYFFTLLQKLQLQGKLNGATGNYAAAIAAYPQVDWLTFSKKFVSSLGLKPNLLTTQIEPHDSTALCFDYLNRLNHVLIDLNQDFWQYNSRGIFKLKKKAGEIGSSTMPHKVNPINFENSEGNLKLANSLLHFMADKLTISRMQRDLSDSTVIRNQGTALGYCMIGYANLLTGLNKIQINNEVLKTELNNHWEILAEPIQTILRKNGVEGAYEKLKELTRGEKIDQKIITDFIKTLKLPPIEKKRLLKLTPSNYNGLSAELVGLINKK